MPPSHPHHPSSSPAASSPEPVPRDASPEEIERQIALGAESELDLSLSGKLPCVSCGYNLQGLSVLGVCPECGSAVRAAILAMVDPLADELRPIPHPRLVAAGLLLWSLGGMVAVLIAWYVVIAGVTLTWRGTMPWTQPWDSITLCVAGSIWASGLGALALVRPHAGLGRNNVLLAGLACLAYVPTGYIAMHLVDHTAQRTMLVGADWWSGPIDRTILRFALCLLLIVVLVGLRPNARILVARSLAIRQGRVDRQTMLVMAGVVSLIMVSDLVGLAGSRFVVGGRWAESLRTFGTAGMLVGALLFSTGVAGAAIDCIRIARAVLSPLPGPRQVFSGTFRDTPTTGGGQ